MSVQGPTCLYRPARLRIVACLLAVVLALWQTILIQAAHAADRLPTRMATMKDAIEMTRWPWGAIWFSPDKTKFVVVFRKGNLQANTNEYSLYLWQTSRLFRSPQPKLLLRMSSSSNRPGIGDVRWLQDNETVVFLGEHPRQYNQIYQFNIRSRILKQLTHEPTAKTGYSVTPDGKRWCYISEEPLTSIFNRGTDREGILVSSQPLAHLLTGQRGGDARYSDADNQLFASYGSRTRKVAIPNKLAVDFPPFLSPDGRYVIARTFVRNVPQIWFQYDDPHIAEWGSRKLAKHDSTWIQQFDLIDLSTGSAKILLNAPLRPGWESEVEWLPDSRSAVITNTYLPLEGVTGEEIKIRRSSRFAVQVHVSTGQFEKISDEDLRLLQWDAKTSHLVFIPGRLNWDYSGPKVYFAKIDGDWRKVPAPIESGDVPEISLAETANDPPQLVAADPTTKQKVLLFDLDPQIRTLRLGKVEEIHWKAPDGSQMKAGLYYPPGYVPGKRYPLVIQTHIYVPDHFFLDGPYTTAFAAQPLAAKGMMVLQIDEMSGHWGDPYSHEEIQREVSVLESAIDYLDTMKIIDRERIGIIGFSRTCVDVAYALTHSKYTFAAANLAPGDGGYFGYLAWNNAAETIGVFFENLNGGIPFGERLQSWAQNSPGFNANKIRTPLRLLTMNPTELSYGWELFAALKRLQKPVEMIYLRDGAHVLERPWDRMVSQQGNVDWFAFWLKGEEDPDQSKSEQYARWHELRSLKPAE
jgi:dipeptidyl aminopeptidase/acylaminoacyl peptidase